MNSEQRHVDSRWVAGLLGLALVLLAGWLSAAQTSNEDETITVTKSGVIAMTLNVVDAERSTNFFKDVLDFQLVSERLESDSTDELGRRRIVELQLGAERIFLRQFLDRPGDLFPNDTKANDCWFQHIAIVVSDLPKAYARLRSHKIRHASSAPQTLPDWNPNAGGISAFYFRDPDGHFLELIHFPKGKGDPRWQQDNAPLFQGIDHTAIVVADTERSLSYYRDKLGLRVVGSSENWGFEQEHLNGVFGAHLLITGLRGDFGPGIELLEYLSPTDGRSLKTPLSANAIAAWEIQLNCDSGRQSAKSSLQYDPDHHALRVLTKGIEQ